MIRSAQKAFTLIEMLVVVALTALIMLALASLIQYFYKTNAATLEDWQSVIAGRTGLESAMVTLREATTLTAATATSLSFAVDSSGTMQSLSYGLENGTLAETGDATSTIVSFVSNGPSTPIFTYYDASGTELTDPIDPTQVTVVLVDVVVDEDPSISGTTLLSGAALRNLLP
jgi:prepilin-type N-terminal cleavage/methylation domain-containing protein